MQKISKKLRRLHALKQIIKEQQICTQEELKEELEKLGLDVTQSSLSRDLTDLSVIKKQGYYHLLVEGRPGSVLPPISSLTWAGPNLIVIKTYPSMAPSMGSLIDDQRIPGVVGTVAGDDTVFIATGPAADKDGVLKCLQRFFR
jgi:transcriptional regulator of arginine metabolism